MEYVEVIADTPEKLEQKIRSIYGEQAICHQTCQRKKNGLGGFFGKVEWVGSVLKNPSPLLKPSTIENNYSLGKSINLNGIGTSYSTPRNLDQEKQAFISVAKSLLPQNKERDRELERLKEREREKEKNREKEKEQADLMNNRVLEMNSEIQEKLSCLMNKVDQLEPRKNDEIEPVAKIRELLKSNDFSEEYSNQIIERLHSKLSMAQLYDEKLVKEKVYDWIEESIPLYKPSLERGKNGKARISILIGPTGVGKTTTVAKLAGKIVNEADDDENMVLSLLTIDVYRIGATEQVQKYGEIMNAPVEKIFSKTSFEENINKYQNYKNILVDTIGRSPKETTIYEEMKNVLSSCLKKADIYLVISASTRERDLEEILEKFEKFNYQAVILTKVDETNCIGNVISALSKKEKPIAYIANGQIVPNDIMEANTQYMMQQLDGFGTER